MSFWPGIAEIRFGLTVALCPLSRSAISLPWRVSLEVSLEEPFKNKWTVSVVFHFRAKAGSQTDKMQGAQGARRHAEQGGQSLVAWTLGLISSQVHCQQQESLLCVAEGVTGTVSAGLWGTYLYEEMSAPYGQLTPDLISALAMKWYLRSRKWMKRGCGMFSLCSKVKTLIYIQKPWYLLRTEG